MSRLPRRIHAAKVIQPFSYKPSDVSVETIKTWAEDNDSCTIDILSQLRMEFLLD